MENLNTNNPESALIWNENTQRKDELIFVPRWNQLYAVKVRWRHSSIQHSAFFRKIKVSPATSVTFLVVYHLQPSSYLPYFTLDNCFCHGGFLSLPGHKLDLGNNFSKHWNSATNHLGRDPRYHMDQEETVPDFFNIQETTICPDCSGDYSS